MVLQANHLAPFLLTRLLERQICDSSGRIVNVSSIMHRFGAFSDAKAFLSSHKAGENHLAFARTSAKCVAQSVWS